MSFPIETFYALEKVGKQKNSVFEFIPGLNLKSLKKQIFRVKKSKDQNKPKKPKKPNFRLRLKKQKRQSLFLDSYHRKESPYLVFVDLIILLSTFCMIQKRIKKKSKRID
jgi:hypothetical protein